MVALKEAVSQAAEIQFGGMNSMKKRNPNTIKNSPGKVSKEHVGTRIVKIAARSVYLLQKADYKSRCLLGQPIDEYRVDDLVKPCIAVLKRIPEGASLNEIKAGIIFVDRTAKLNLVYRALNKLVREDKIFKDENKIYRLASRAIISM